MGVLFWEVARQGTSMWAQWIRDRYLRKANLWKVAIHSGCSSSWISILKAREWILPKVKYLIFEGKTINLWYDPWINGKSLVDIFGRVTYDWGPPKDCKVAALISNGKWNKPNRSPAELDMVWLEIQEIEVGGKGDDILIWPASKIGSLGLSEAWNAVRTNEEVLPWAKWLWHSIQTPKHCLCSWQAYLNKLPTLVRLQRRGLTTSTICSLCATEAEDADHLFLGCSFSRFIWCVLMRDLSIRSTFPHLLSHLPQWLNTHLSDPLKKELAYIILTTTFWHLWLERNNRIFRRTKQHKLRILHRIRDSIKMRAMSKVFRVLPNPDYSRISSAFGVQILEKALVHTTIKWLLPQGDWFKLNTDGSLADDRGGYGALVRNNKGDFIIGLAGRLDLPSINLLELKAIERGVLIGIAKGVDKLWIESDSTTALAWLHGKGKIPWTALRSLRHIHLNLLHFSVWKATHINREGNSPADMLASHQSSRDETIFHPHQLWPDMVEAIEQDRSVGEYTRTR
ncbi:hypothetical protein QJS10_CPA09g00486 [Acorus calamus]|uniref:RNase H type-1 domain-containing protein n=1 Tax=Acorus calamus TaxID=4465 RepID=A0AAV9E8K5_ACOCL|nr:hypothetical protein QJS10_CPA09g00486 [Acorus calamus]